MRRWMRVHITKGEKAIVGRLSYYTDSLTVTPDEGVCKKALLHYGRRIDEVTLRFHSNGTIDKVYIKNEVWDVKEQCIDTTGIRKCYKLKTNRRKSRNVITELPDEPKEDKKEKRKGEQNG